MEPRMKKICLFLTMIALLALLPQAVFGVEGEQPPQEELVHAVPQCQGVANAIDRARSLTDVVWSPLTDMPGMIKEDGSYLRQYFKAGVTYQGVPYSGVLQTGTYIGLDLNLGTFLSALQDERSVLYTTDLYDPYYPKKATYYGTVCSKLVQYALDIPGAFSTAHMADIPGMETVAPADAFDVADIRLGDVIVDTQRHATICTDILYDGQGQVAYIEISEAVMPTARRLLWSVEDFYVEFAGYQLCRYEHIDDVPARSDGTELIDPDPALMCEYGDRYHYPVSETETGVVHILKNGYEKAVVLRDGVVVDTVALSEGTTAVSFDRSLPGVIEVYLEDGQGVRSNSVFACVAQAGVTVTDSTKILEGELTVSHYGTIGTPLYVQVDPGQAVFCALDGAAQSQTIRFDPMDVLFYNVRVAYKSEYGIYHSDWVQIGVDNVPGGGENISTDPLLSQGGYWQGMTLTTGSFRPIWQEGSEAHWTYTKVPVIGGETYHSVGAGRLWFFDGDGYPLGSFNAYKDGLTPFRFTVPENAAYINISYSAGSVEPGTEALCHLHRYAPQEVLPGCTEQGYIVQSCVCGHSYVERYVAATGHQYENGTCTACGQRPDLMILRQPQDVRAKLGQQFSVTVAVRGEGLSYQWYYRASEDGKFLKSGVRTDTYSTVMTADRDGRQLCCEITDAHGNVVITQTVTLELVEFQPLQIVVEPSDVQGVLGAEVSVKVEAVGEELRYQWYVRNAGASRFTRSSVCSDTYCTVMDEERDGREVYCVVSDGQGNTAVTKTVRLIREVSQPLQIVKEPVDAEAVLGAQVRTCVEAIGEGLTYRWYVRNAGGTVFYQSSNTSNVYTATMTKDRDGREVFCVITDAMGNCVTTDAVRLERVAGMRPVIVQQPVDTGAVLGSDVTVWVEASGTDLTYQWYYRNAGSDRFRLSSVCTDTYTVTMTPSRAGREVFCVITDPQGAMAVSDTVALTVDSATPLQILRQPVDAEATEGSTLNVSVAADGEGLRFQWYYRDAGSTAFSRSSVCKDTYSITMTASRAGREVFCVVTDALGRSITSEVARLDRTDAAPLTAVIQGETAEAPLGELLTVGVDASGTQLRYQWYIRDEGEAIFRKSSVTEAAYSVVMTQGRAGRQVYCVVTDGYGRKAVTDTVTLTVAEPDAEDDPTAGALPGETPSL